MINRRNSVRAPFEVEDVMMVGDHFTSDYLPEQIKGANNLLIYEKVGYDGTYGLINQSTYLKRGLAYLENNNLLVAGEFVENPIFKDFNKVVIDENESYSANCIWMNGTVIVPEGYEKTKKAIEELGYKIIEVDTSEYRKIDGGLSCLSLRF